MESMNDICSCRGNCQVFVPVVAFLNIVPWILNVSTTFDKLSFYVVLISAVVLVIMILAIKFQISTFFSFSAFYFLILYIINLYNSLISATNEDEEKIYSIFYVIKFILIFIYLGAIRFLYYSIKYSEIIENSKQNQPQVDEGVQNNKNTSIAIPAHNDLPHQIKENNQIPQVAAPASSSNFPYPFQNVLPQPYAFQNVNLTTRNENPPNYYDALNQINIK